jgi:hypothetical protein
MNNTEAKTIPRLFDQIDALETKLAVALEVLEKISYWKSDANVCCFPVDCGDVIETLRRTDVGCLVKSTIDPETGTIELHSDPSKTPTQNKNLGVSLFYQMKEHDPNRSRIVITPTFQEELWIGEIRMFFKKRRHASGYRLVIELPRTTKVIRQKIDNIELVPPG